MNYKNINQMKMAQEAISNNLFNNEWQLIFHYKDILSFPNKRFNIALVYENGKAIAAATLSLQEYYINVFVLPSHRGKGFGKDVVEELLLNNKLKKHHVHAFKGEDGSEKFYKKIGIACFKNIVEITDEEFNLIQTKSVKYQDIIDKKVLATLEKYKKEDLVLLDHSLKNNRLK
jgi:GNAT superfamily N-acetyltransferase